MTDEVAGLLKRTRIERGLSIDAVGHDTKIPVHYLRLLEGDGDPYIVADVLYLIPFLPRGMLPFLIVTLRTSLVSFLPTCREGISTKNKALLQSFTPIVSHPGRCLLPYSPSSSASSCSCCLAAIQTKSFGNKSLGNQC